MTRDQCGHIRMQRCHFLTWCLQARLRRYSGASCCGNPVLLLFFIHIFIKMQQRALKLSPHSSGGFPIKRYKTCSHANWNLPVKRPITSGAIGCQRGTEFIAFMKFRIKVSKFCSVVLQAILANNWKYSLIVFIIPLYPVLTDPPHTC